MNLPVTASARMDVLRLYRRMRGVTLSPYDTMQAIRNNLAQVIALAVWCDITVPPDTVEQWHAADDYVRSMVHRTTYWYRPGRYRRRPAHPRAWLSAIRARIERTIGICPK